jgi:hypothetical protein
LASRDVLIRSGVFILTFAVSAQFLSFDACRLCRFNNLFAVNLLFISLLPGASTYVSTSSDNAQIMASVVSISAAMEAAF